MSVAVFLIVVVAAMAVISDLMLILAHKRAEMGILGAMGARPEVLRRIFLWLGSLLVAVGALLGSVSGDGCGLVPRSVSTPGAAWRCLFSGSRSIPRQTPGGRNHSCGDRGSDLGLLLGRGVTGRRTATHRGTEPMSVSVAARGVTKTYRDGVRSVEVLKGTISRSRLESLSRS